MSPGRFYGGVGAFTLAVAVHILFAPSVFVWLWLMVLAGAVVLVSASRTPHVASIVTVCMVTAGFGVLRVDIAEWQYERIPALPAVGERVTLVGVVRTEPDIRERSQQLVVELPAGQRVLVSTERYARVAYGDRVQVSGRLEHPTSFTTEFGREFDYPGFLRVQGIGYRMSFTQVEVLGSGYGQPFITGLLQIKQVFMDQLELLIPEPQVGLAQGLLLGVKQALGQDLEAAFRKTGIIHIVVLSGYNVMLVVAFVATILSFFSIWVRTVVGIIAIVSFALLVGLSATVVRASIMASLVLIAPLLGREYNILRALCVAGVVMVIVNPLILIYDIGFQLSFLATLGLVVVAPHFETLLVRAPAKLKVKEFFIATVATQIAVSPLLLYQIGELSIVSVVVNVLVLPMVAVAMLFTFVTGIVSFLSLYVAQVLALPTYWSLTYIIVMAETFAEWRYAAVTVPPFAGWVVVVSYLLMGGLLYGVEQYRVRLVARQALVGKPTSNISVADWVIEEVIDEAVVLTDVVDDTKAGRRQRRRPAAAGDETPIFFR